MSNGFFFALSPEDASKYGPFVGEYHITVNKPLIGNNGIQDQKQKDDIAYVLEGMFVKEDDDEWIVSRGLLNDFWLNVDPTKRDSDWIYDFIGHESINSGLSLLRGRPGFDWEVLDNPECVRRMIARGYDGTLVYEKHLKSYLSWFVINENQIKFLRSVEDKE